MTGGASRMLLGAGREAEVYLQVDGTVLKLMRNATDMERAEREAAACRLVAQHGQAAPMVHGIIIVDERPGLVMERIEGTALLTALEHRPLKVFSAARVLAETHAALHDCPAPPQLPDLKDELNERISIAETLPRDLKDLAHRVLDDLPRGDRLCHGDFHLGNILGSWAAPVVIDWANAARGEPIADVAKTELLHRIGALPPETPAMFRALARVGRRLLTDRYLALYQRSHRLDGSLERWRFVHAAARLGEPVPDEHPSLLDLLHRSSTAMST